MNQNQQNPPPQEQQPAPPAAENQWEVTYHWPDEAPEPEIYRSLAIAFAASQPNPDDDDYDWRYTRRADIEARFAAGENNIRVAWSAQEPDAVYVTIRRL